MIYLERNISKGCPKKSLFLGLEKVLLTSLHYHGDTLSVGSTSSDQGQLAVLVLEAVGGVREDPDPRGSEWMTFS